MRRLLLWYRMSASAMLGPEMVWRLFPPSPPISFHWYVWCASRSVPLSQWKAKWGLSGKGPAIVQEFAKKPENCFRNVFVFQCFKVCYGSFRLFQGLFKFDACFFFHICFHLFISVHFFRLMPLPSSLSAALKLAQASQRAWAQKEMFQFLDILDKSFHSKNSTKFFPLNALTRFCHQVGLGEKFLYICLYLFCFDHPGSSFSGVVLRVTSSARCSRLFSHEFDPMCGFGRT